MKNDTEGAEAWPTYTDRKPETERRGGVGGGGGRGRACGARGKDTGCARESEEKQTAEREGTESGEIAAEGMLSLSRPLVKDCYIIIRLSRL